MFLLLIDGRFDIAFYALDILIFSKIYGGYGI